MPFIRFVKNFPEREVASGANLMEELLLAGLPVASSCHGDGICGKCRVRVISGMENLSPINALERMLRDRLRIPNEFRISCQSRVFGDVVVDTTYW
jgi:2Fe-2S ferredoxin